MKLRTLVFRTMLKNSQLYSLYFFALLFSSGLYFAFLTLADNPSVIKMNSESMKAGAVFEVASYLLVAIVFFFVLYANQLFLKRRSKEFGLYQLIGLSKPRIARMLFLENSVLWILAIAIGISCGFIFSRFFALLFLKVTHMERVISLQFTTHSVVQSIIVFIVLFALMYVQSVGYVWRSKLIDLFHAANKTEQRVKKWSLFSTIVGLIGIALMGYGYYRATILFSITDEVTMNELILRMAIILFSTIFGSFLFFRYTVATIVNFIRKRRNGHVTVGDVVALTPMMHRMKSSALSLTLITTLTALAIGVLSLAYISYSSVKTSSQQSMPYDMGVFNGLGQEFEKALQNEDIAFEKNTYHFKTIEFNYKDIMKNELSKTEEELTTSTMIVMKQSEVQQKIKNLSLNENEIAFYNYTKIQSLLAPMQTDKKVQAVELKQSFTLTTLSDDMFVPNALSFGSPVAVVTDDVYAQMQDVTEGAAITSFTGYNILNEEDLDQAEKLYREKTNDGEMIIKLKDSDHTVTYDLKTQSAYYENNFQMMGLLIFVAAFLGLAFLLTTGSILYFKQMSEADQEAPQFEMLRKIGFTTDDMMRGVRQKQWFNFGIPLVIGVAHSYFAVRSGWMLFGTDFELPFITVLVIYALLYGAFAWMSVRYYKKVITNK